jgi:GNAT superfamily N-acetyltransferase
MMLPEVITAGPARLPAVVGLIARAFVDLPATQWLVAERHVREQQLRAQFGIWVEHAFDVGYVDMLADGSAAAVWFDRTQPIPDPPDYGHRLQVVCGRHAERFAVLDQLFADNHPWFPHHHLMFLAVAPELQGTGRARAVVESRHRNLDAAGITAYLEAATADNTHVYRQFGYTVGRPFRLPQGPPFWPMVRRPSTASFCGIRACRFMMPGSWRGGSWRRGRGQCRRTAACWSVRRASVAGIRRRLWG